MKLAIFGGLNVPGSVAQTGLSKSTDDLGTLLEQARKPLNLRGPTGVVSPTRCRHFISQSRIETRKLRGN